MFTSHCNLIFFCLIVMVIGVEMSMFIKFSCERDVCIVKVRFEPIKL